MNSTISIDVSAPPPGDTDPSARLRATAGATAVWDIVHWPSTPGKFGNRVRNAARSLEQLESALIRRCANEPADAPASSRTPEWLVTLCRDRRVLRQALSAVSARQQTIDRLPRAVLPHAEEPRCVALARVYLEAMDGEFSAGTLRTFLELVQGNEPLNVEELWDIGPCLEFACVESLIHDAHDRLRHADSASDPHFSTRIAGLRAMMQTAWDLLVDPLVAFDAYLSQDPAGAYPQMDAESRELYRRQVAFAARYSDCTELDVARIALDLARSDARQSGDPADDSRTRHIGYYLVDQGFPRLAKAVNLHPPLSWRIRRFVREQGEDFYIGGICLLSLLLLTIIFLPISFLFASVTALAIAFLALIPAVMQAAVELVNDAVTALFGPSPLPKLDFSKRIPADCATLVAVPTLLLNERQVRGLVTSLEVRYLANRDPNLHFALLTDLPDSITKPREHDTDPMVRLAVRLIDKLNAKYASRGEGSFLLLHRHRIFNTRQGVWMSWERKRGKLLDLNSLLAGEHDAFPVKAGSTEVLRGIRYVLTLDSDTQLPCGAAARMVGAIAHPLNRAIVDPKLRIVTKGYGILQPRVGVAVRSTVRSRLAALFSGQSGFDIYTRAVSDAYQDLFGEGIYTGKGIYDVAALHAVLNHRLPRNALLSHDLIEGAYARAGLVSDVELIDDYPSHYSAYSRRQHRWVRGDWQITQWLFSRVPDESGQRVSNPITLLSRWKIFDNLRRSLVDPSLLIFFVAGWLGLPGGPLYWTLTCLCLLFLPAIIQFAFSLGRILLSGQFRQWSGALVGLGRASQLTLLHLVLLPHQTLVTFDAVIRTMIRWFITGERLLEWETAEQAEAQSARRTPVDRYLAHMGFIVLGMAAVIWLFAAHRTALLYAAPVLLVWALSSLVAAWLDDAPNKRPHIPRAAREYLLVQALRTWSYFEHFSSETHHFLIPDNVEEKGMVEAPRVSPTNIGLLLNARQSACAFGFLTIPEFAARTSQTMATIDRLEKFRGHLYNWYDTQTLQPLGSPLFVSSVDSGNFVASLYVLRSGAVDLRSTPLLHHDLFVSLRTYWRIACSVMSGPASTLRFPAESAPLSAWIAWMPEAEAALTRTAAAQPVQSEGAWWLAAMHGRLEAIRSLLLNYLPWMLHEYKPLQAWFTLAADEPAQTYSIEDALAYAQELSDRIAGAWDGPAATAEHLQLAVPLRQQLAAALEHLRALRGELRAIAEQAEQLAQNTDFAFLVDPDRKLLSIGYDSSTQQILKACYDLVASEARMATFLAIARRDLPLQSWLSLSRDHTRAYGRSVLLSWTGTMFEYLMPGLWMRSYRGTLVACNEENCVYVQRAFARSLRIPWGISESGTAQRNDSGHYSYHAFGVPRIALNPKATAGPVISPYSTFLALNVDPFNAIRNLRRMSAAKWVGHFGFYEAADYIKSPHSPELVRQWMAHHQGMSLLAVTNLLHRNVVQHWFHANPVVQAAELLLYEAS